MNLLSVERAKRLSNHLRSPEFSYMRSYRCGAFLGGQRGVRVADLVGHAGEFLDLAMAHATSPEGSKVKAPSRRAVTTSATPAASAARSASVVGAETETSAP